MWDLHYKALNFGMTCKESCDCAAGWIRVFRRGDVYGKTKEKSNTKKARKQPEPEERNVIPRKRSRTDASIEDSTSVQSNPAPPQKKPAFALKSSQLQKNAAGRGSVPASASAHLSSGKVSACLRPYRVAYNVLQPLGFYCVTRTIAGRQVCVLTSICPTGQSRQRNPLIQEGTCGKP